MNKSRIPHPARTHQSAKKATLQIHFLVVGGGIGGLACAVALRRVGHQVTLLEKSPDFIGSGKHRGIRLSPNMTKIFNYWGMREQLAKICSVLDRIILSRFETAYLLGTHCWEREMLEEAGGEFMASYQCDVRQLLLETARELGAEARTNAEVVEIAQDCRSVRLASGEVLQADVIIGADGSQGICRKTLDPHYSLKGSGAMLFNSVIPADRIYADPELRSILQQEQGTQWTWFGHERALICFPIGPSQDLACYFYMLDNGAQTDWNDILTPEQFAPYVVGAEPRIQKLARLSKPARIRVIKCDFPEEWVHDTGRLVLLGSAAHPYPLGNVYGPSMNMEDASVLAKLFSHLRDEAQILSFLYAFQNLREERCLKNRDLDLSNIWFLVEREGEVVSRRDSMMRAKYDQGLDVLSGDDEDTTVAQWDHNRELFGYDAEDAADTWWVQWGLLQERANATRWEDNTQLEMFSLDAHVRVS